MKTKILTFSKCKNDKVVHQYCDLTPLNEQVFIYLISTDPQSLDYGLLGVVLKVGNTYFYFTTFCFENLLDHRSINFVTNFAKNFFEKIELLIQNGESVPNLYVEVCKQEGHDVARLQEYCERCKRSKKTDRN